MAQPQKKKLGELLLKAGILDELQLRSALAHQKQWGGRLGAVLLKLNLITEQKLVAFLARQFRSPVMDLKRIDMEAETLSLIPKNLVLKLRVLPLFKAEENGKDILAVAMANPGDLVALDEIHFTTRMEAKPIIVSDPQLEKAIDYYYDGLGIPPADRDAKPSTEFTFHDVIMVTKEYLNANKVAAEASSKTASAQLTNATKDYVIGESALDTQIELDDGPDDDGVLVFSGGGQQQIALDDTYDHEQEVTVESDSGGDISHNSERVLRGLVNLLVEKGIVTKDEIKEAIKHL